MDGGLEQLLQQGSVWKRGGDAPTYRRAIPTGFAALDEHLPGGGWPSGALTELLLDAHGLGELALLMPALVRLSRQCQADGSSPRWVCWVAPPFMPYAPALAAWGLPPERMLLVHPPRRSRAGRHHAVVEDVLWAAEQALYSGQCCAVLVWAERATDLRLRRLQLAAEHSDAWAVLFRSAAVRHSHSPAALRVRLGGDGVLCVLKCRGGRPVRLHLAAALRSGNGSPG